MHPHIWCVPYRFPGGGRLQKNVISHILQELWSRSILDHVINGFMVSCRTEIRLVWKIKEGYINLCEEEKSDFSIYSV